VELLVVIAIIGLLVGLLLPAVQASREASRRAACASNLHNQVLALHTWHDAHRRFPPGRRWAYGFDTSWYLQVLPQLEQASLPASYSESRHWSNPANLPVANAELSILRCPSSVLTFPGDCDYGGLEGSALTSRDWSTAFDNGVLTDETTSKGRRIAFSSITDGTSQTIAIGESADRVTEAGRWISGLNCFSHDNGSVGTEGGELFSLHPGGVQVAFADGGTRLLAKAIDPYVIGALCTRDLGEVIDTSGY
jgi:prepilin-type processing-associated H-X9-DG protein